MNINCKFCRAKLTVPDNVYGKLIRCSHCHKTFVVNVPRSDANAVIDETDRPPTDLASVPKAARFQHAMNPVAGKGTTPTEKPAYSSFREFLLPGLVSPFFSLVFAFAMTLLINPPSTPSGVFLGVFLYVTLQPVFWMFFWGWLIFWLVSFHYAHGRCKGHLKSGDIRQATAIATRFRNGCWITYGVGLFVSIPIFLLYLPSFSPRIPSPIVVDEIEVMEEGLYDENGLLLDEEEPPPEPPPPDDFSFEDEDIPPDLADSTSTTMDIIRKSSERNATAAYAESERKAVEVRVESILAGMVQIPGKGYKMGKTEVTQAQWKSIMGGNLSQFKGDDNPVEHVSWDDCQQFLAKLNASPTAKASGLVFRLPTEEEWEFACRAGATGDYCKLADGTEITFETLGEVAWFGANSGNTTHPVGQKEPNAFGLYDMHGNVWEWTDTAVGGGNRVDRGGGWLDSAGDCESSYRFGFAPSRRLDSLGFRLCADSRAD